MSPWGEELEEQEALGHGSASRVITVSYGSGFFTYLILESGKAYYAEGEDVKIHYKVRNDGTVAANFLIEVFDNETGEKICTFSSAVPLSPGESLEVDGWKHGLTMPTHDWVLRCELTP